MAKQFRPIDKYFEQFEDPTIEDSVFQSNEKNKESEGNGDETESLVESLKQAEVQRQEATPTTKEEAIDYYTNPRKAGYRTIRYMDQIREQANKLKVSSDPNFQPTEDNTYSIQEDVLRNEIFMPGARMVWNSMQKAIDEIQISSLEGRVIGATAEIEALKETAQKRADNLSKPLEYTEEEQERLTELENDIKDYEQDILENKQELKEDIDILGDYWIQQTEIDKLKNSTSMFPDSWRELADGMGGTMSEMSAFVASMILPAAGTAIGAGIATGTLSGAYSGAVTSWSGPGAVLTAGVGATVGFVAGVIGSGYAQYHAREHESYAEMQEAYNAFIEGKKREYRLRNNGKEMPEDELRALEKKARRDVKSVYTQNMALFTTDVLELGAIFIPWSRFAERLNKLSRLKRTGLKAGTVVGGFGLGSVWEGREEGDQFLIKNNFIRGVYDDQDISTMQSLFSSNGFASIFAETTKGMGVNAYNNVFDENFIAGRTNSKEFDAAVASGMMIGGFMGGGRTAVGLSMQGINIANDRLRYASEAQEFADEIYNKYINAEQDKASMQWFWERLSKKGGVKNIKKTIKRLQRSFPKLYDEMDTKLLSRMVGEAEIAYNIATGDTVKDLDIYEQEMLFRSIMALQKKMYNNEQSNNKSKEELDEIIAALPAPKREEDQGLPELQQKKAELAAAEGMLEALEKEKINGISIEELLKQAEEKEPNVRHHIAANQAQIAYLKNKLEGAKTKEGEQIPGLREEYSNMLKEYEKNDGDVIVSDELQEKTNAHSNNLAATYANEASYYSLIGSALDKESGINNAIAVRNHPFFEKYNDLLKKKQEAKEEEEFIPALNQQVKPGDTVEVKTPEGATVRGTYEEERDIDEESGEEIKTGSVVDDKGNRIGIADNTPIRVVQPKSEVETELAETFAENENEKTEKEEETKPGPEENTPEEPVEEPADNPEKEEVPEEEKNSSSTASGQKQSDENNKTQPVGETKEGEEVESELPEEPIGTDTGKSVKGSITVGKKNDSVEAQEAGSKLYAALLRIAKEAAAKFTDTFTVEYQINLDPLRYAATPGLYEKIQNREKLTVDEIKKLKLKARFTNPVLSAVAPELYILDHRGDNQPDAKNGAAIRDKIYKAYLANQIAYGTARIRFSREGKMLKGSVFNSKTGDINPIASLFVADPNKSVTAKQRVGVVQSDGNVVQSEDDSIGRLTAVKEDLKNLAGQIYAFVYNPFTKKKIPVKLNTRDLSSAEIDLITLLLLEITYAKGNKLADFAKNLTNRQLLNLLVTTYNMKAIGAYGLDKINTRLVIEKGEVRFDFKDKNTYKVLTLNNQEEFRKWASQQGVLKRKVSQKLLGKSVFEAISDDTINEITILGKTYKRGVNDDYINDFLTNDNDSDVTTHTLSTDITLDENGSPLKVGATQIYYDTSVQSKPTSKRGQTKKKKTTKGTATQQTSEGEAKKADIEKEKASITESEFTELKRLAKFFLDNPKEPTVSGSVVIRYPALFKALTDIERRRQEELNVVKEDRNEKEHDLFYDLLEEYDIEEGLTEKVHSDLKNKINAKYDAKLAALNQAQQTSEKPTILERVKAKIAEIKENKSFIKLTPDGKNYVNTRTGKTYTRVTTFIGGEEIVDGIGEKESMQDYRKRLEELGYEGKEIEQKLVVASSLRIGTAIDEFVRDFFNGNLKSLSKYKVADKKALEQFKTALENLKKQFDERGETVVAEDIILYNDEAGVAGTVDLLTYDEKGVFRIYDMKTMRGNQFTDTHRSGANKGKTKYDNPYFKGNDSNKVKHQKQTSLYRILLNNTHGEKAAELGIIPIVVQYSPGEEETSKLELLPTLPVTPLDQVAEAAIDDVQESTEPEMQNPVEETGKPSQNAEGEVNAEIDNESEVGNIDDIDNVTLNMEVGPEYTEDTSSVKINEDQARSRLRRILGDSIPVQFQKSLIKIAGKGRYAYGVFRKAMIVLSEQAVNGAEFHEAEHAVEFLWLSDQQLKELNAETAKTYGKATQKEIDAIKEQYKQYNLSDEMAAHIHYAELRAEDYRMYALAGEEMGFTGKTLRWFKKLKYSVEYFANPNKAFTTDLLFARMSSGYYAKKDPIPEKIEKWAKGDGMVSMMMSALNISDQAYDQSIDTLLAYIVALKPENGGVAGVSNVTNFTKEIKIVKNVVIALLERFANDQTKTKEQRENIQKLLGTKENEYKDGVLDQLTKDMLSRVKQLNIREKEETERANKDLESATKDAFESSNKENANINTKYLISFLVKKDKEGKIIVNPETGLPVIANPSKIFNELEAKLSNIVNYQTFDKENGTIKTVFAYDRMLAILDNMAEQDPTFERLRDIVKNELSDNERTQFFNTMSKSNNNFLTALQFQSLVEEAGETVVNHNFRFINPQQNSKKYRIIDKWLGLLGDNPLFRTELGENDEVIVYGDAELAKNIVAKFDTVVSDILNLSSDITTLPTENAQKLRDLLREAGILMSTEGVQAFYQMYYNDSIKKGTEDPSMNSRSKMVGELKFIFGNSTKKGAQKPYTIYSISKGDSKTPLKKVDFVTENYLKQERRVVGRLAEAESVFQEDYDQTTILKTEGRKAWIYSLNNYFKKKSLQYNASTYYANNLLGAVYNKGSILLNYLQREGTSINYRTFNIFQKKGGISSGVEYKDIVEADEYNLRVNMTMNDDIYSPPTMADKGVWLVYQGPKYLSTSQIKNIKYDAETDTYVIPDTILNVFQDYAISELNRIRDAQKQLFGDDEALAWADEELVQFYHFMDLLEDGTPDRNSANALKSQLFEGMLTTEFLENLGIAKKGRVIKFAVDKLKQNPEFKAAMSKVLNERIRKEVVKAVEYSVVKQFENGNLAIGSTDIATFREFLKDSNADMAARHLISGYTLKSMISSIEIMKAFSGDPAYYKSMVEMQKRLPELIAPGQDLNVTSPEQETFTAAVLQDITKKSEYYETYLQNFKDFNDKFNLGFTEKQIVEILKPYDKKGINQTDAQGYITLTRWKSIMEMLGKWTQTEAKELDEAYERLLEGKGTQEDMKLIAAMPLKGMYFDLRDHKGLKVPTYFKYSQAVLFPQLVKGSEELQTLYDTMLKKGVDEVIFESGVKVGAQFPERFTADKQGSVLELKNSMVLRNEYWKLQQDLRPHTSPTQLEGSQIKRNIIANVELDKTYSVIVKTDKKQNQYKEVTGRELVQMAHDADIALSNLGKEELLEEFGVKTSEDGLTYKIVDYTKLAAILEREFLNDTKTTNKLLKSLQLNADKTGFKIPLSENPFADKIDQKIGALITKRTVKLEMPGGSYIQMSNYGFRRVQRFSSLSKEEQASISRVTNPKPLRPATFNKNKEHVRAQLMLPSYFKDLIPGNEKMSSLEIGKYIEDKNLLRGIAYRIPNQSMSSIDAFEVVGFLPKSMGDTVVAYDDITSKTGSDFDIDKMYIMLPNYGVNKETGEIYYIRSDKKYKKRSMQRKALQNRKLEIYDAIVTDPKTYISLVTPLDSIGTKFRAAKVRLFENISKFSQQEITSLKALESSKEYDKYVKAVNKVLNRLEDLEWFSPSYQLETKQSYIGGKFGVGQVARALVDHAISQFNPIKLNQYLGIGNKRDRVTSLADIYNERKEIISNIISGRLNAYVDIAKDPYIFYLNNNSLTANTVSLLDRAGVSPEWTDFFMPQPILKKFVAYTRYNQAENTTKKMRNGKMLSAEDLIFDEYRQAFAEAKMSEGVDGATIQDYYKEFDGILASLKEKYKNGLPDLRELFSEEQLIGMLKNGGNMANPGHVVNQIKVYLIFNKLKGIASAVNDAVSASKQDVEGSSGGSANVIASINKKNKAILNDTVLGVDARFNNTMLDAYTQNSVKLMQELFKEQFDLFTPGYQAALAKLYSYIIDESIATDPFKIRKAYTSLKAIYLGSKIEGFTQDKLKELLAGDNNIFKRLAYYQLSKESPIQNNELVNSLILNRASSAAEMNSIQFRSGLMDGKDQDRLEAAWEDLLVHEDAKVRKFAADLALYAYATSGMTQRMFSFHHLIPFDYENMMLQRNVPEAYTKYNGDIAAEYQERTDSFSILPFVEPMIRNFSDIHEYAPTVSASTITNKRIDKNTKKIIAFATGDLKVSKEIIEDDNKYEEFSKFVKLGDDLYELVGFSTINEGKISNPVYAKTNKLGYSEKGNIIIEPFITDTSIFRKNRVETFTKEDQDGKTVKKYKAISLDTIIDGITFKEGANEKNRFLTNPREFDTSGYNYDTNEIEGNEELYHLENTLAEQAREYARLSNKLLGFTTAYTGNKLSTATKNTLKKLGLSENEIESFEGYLESNFEAFRGKRLDVLAAFRYDSFMRANKESLKEIELLTQAADKELDKYLIEYLEEFGVKITERTIEEMAQRYGIGRLGVTNSLKKIIEVAQDRNAALMPEEFSHMLIDLVGADNEVIKPLMDNITSWGKYPQVVADYKNDPAYQLSDGSINFAKIKKEAAGKLLAEAIVYANRKIEPKGFFLKIAYDVYNSILSILQGIKFLMGLSEHPFLLEGSMKETGSAIEVIANDIANKVLEGEKAWMENYREAREEQFKARSYEESLADYPKAAKLLEEIIVKLKGRLVGSLAIRAQGILMRPDSETVHDLDFEISKKDLVVKTRQDVWDWVNNVVTKEIENFIPIYVWDKGSSGKFIVNGVVTEYPYIAKKFRDLRGNFVSRMKQLSQFERDNVILIDFFLNSEDRDVTKEGFATWQDIFEAKIGSEKGFKRDKDYYDIRRFIPYEEYADTNIEMDSEFTYYNISRAEIVKRAKEEIDKAAKDGAFRKWGGVYYQWSNPSKKVNMSLEAVLNINNKVFNGGKVVRLVQTPNGKIGQRKVAVFPNNYIDPQLGLFDNPYKPKCD